VTCLNEAELLTGNMWAYAKHKNMRQDETSRKALWRNLGWQALPNRQLARVSSARNGVFRYRRYASIQLLTSVCKATGCSAPLLKKQTLLDH